MIVQTERLELRPLARSEDSELHALWTSPGVRRFLFDDEVIPADRTREFLDRSESLFRDEGYGLWGARLHGRADLIGFSGLWHFRDSPEHELLFGIADPMVGRGFGTEIARAVVDHAFTELAFREVRASTDGENHASVRVLEKSSFRFDRRASVDGLDTLFYVLAGRAR